MSGLDSFFDSYYRLRPVNATFTGIHHYDGRLPDWSPDGLAAALDEMRRLRADLVAARADDDDLHDVAVRDRELAVSFLDIQIAEHESAHFQRGNPSLAVGEVAFGIIALMTRPFIDAATRAAAAASRLAAAATFLEGACRSMAAGVPDDWRAKALRECDGVDRLIGAGLTHWLAAEEIPASVERDLIRAAHQARAAVETFRAWLRRDAASAPVDRVACGSDLFDLLLARGHWCDRPRRDLAAEAGAALNDALGRLDEIARQVAPGGWPEVQQRLVDAHPTAETYLATYQAIWDRCRQRAVERDLVAWPDYPIRYVPIPPQTRDAAPFLYYLFYRSPAPFDWLPVHDYVVTPIDGIDADEQQRRLRAANTSVITLNHVIHHGAIGHHVQNYFAYQGPSEIGRVAAVDCASRIGMFLGGTMAEGWACYATDLMEEHGFLTPEETVSQQHTRARLLARAVVDIGLHAGSMTFDEAVAVYRDRIGMPADAARSEACKNSMFPGTAVMYWLGTDGIHRLRRERERAAAAAFSLRAFHDRLLSFGSIPVPLIARVWS